MRHYGYKFTNQPPIFLREREDCYCPLCYKRMWPTVPPTDYHRRLLAILPITHIAEARASTCCRCHHTLAS